MPIVNEMMLAQEQAVIRRKAGYRKGVEAAFGVGETEGSIVLTNRRLVYVHSNEKEEDLPEGLPSPLTGRAVKKLFFSDVENLNSMEMDSSSVEIPVEKIVKVTGHHKELIAPKLEVKWMDTNMAVRTDEFIQQITGSSRKKNLSDWAKVIEKLKANQLRMISLPPAPSESTLEGRIVAVLGDLQEKGVMMLEEEVEETYHVDLEPDQVESACNKLAASGLIKRTTPTNEEGFYRKVSPLGDDDLSA